ncbi:transposase [Mucilaginibacter sp. PPCGB 2223]|uniref:REP-associated tyrosine transposase n=1 Tax=Mucilaginibacter sp. PPCGB 2223 TaxID=1886027 RepID=UPI0008264697|nr:transposase [Mucilaginibacter sp. PPCGB 2223]OCX51450.1 transposase [Mucilaginibacter sp. PPCGB 2223]
MSDQYRVRNHEAIHFLTFTIVDWIDIFTRPAYKNLIIESLAYCQQQKGLELYAYCLMTNHLHLLASATEPGKLSDIVRDFKKHTNKKIIQLIGEENESRRDWMLYRFEYHAKYNNRIQDYKVWQDGYHAIECSTNQIIDQKLNYIHQNPVRAQIVSEPEHYIYSSAIDYAGGKGLLDIILLS